MDEEIQRAARSLEAAPCAVEAARRYEAALRRAGRTWDTEDRILDKYICRNLWDDLPLSEDGRRRCPRCDAEILFWADLDRDTTPRALVAARRPFGFPATTESIERVLRALLRGRLHTAEEPHPGRAHLSLERGCSFATEVAARAEEMDPLLSEFGVSVLPFRLSVFPLRGRPRKELEAELERVTKSVIRVARRVVPAVREPIILFGTDSLLEEPPPLVPIRHVLGWLALGSFVARDGTFLPPEEDDIRQLLLERWRHSGQPASERSMRSRFQALRRRLLG